MSIETSKALEALRDTIYAEALECAARACDEREADASARCHGLGDDQQVIEKNRGHEAHECARTIRGLKEIPF